MFRPLLPTDREVYLSLTKAFYESEAVLHPIPEENRIACFEELMRASTYAEGMLFEVDGAAVGYALFSKGYSQEAGGMVLWIEELYVIPAMRGKGIAKAFFAHLLTERGREFARIRLEIEPDNHRARALYRAHGFVPLDYAQMVLSPQNPR